MMRRAHAVAFIVVLLTVAGCSGGGSPTSPTPRPIWSVSGTGNTVFDMPTAVSRVRVIGTFSGNSSNFIIWVGTDLLVNELLGTFWGPLRYEGIHATTGGVVRIENSTLVVWSLTEVR